MDGFEEKFGVAPVKPFFVKARMGWGMKFAKQISQIRA